MQVITDLGPKDIVPQINVHMAKTGKMITNQPPEMHIKRLQLTHYHLLIINNIFT